MPTPTKGKRLGGSPAHERAILANLATSLFEHGSITTTETRARRLRPFAERLVTKARRGTLHARRQVMQVIRDKDVVHALFTEIGPRFANRPGGYTRITKLGPRPGDNAPMAVIELVEALEESSGGAGAQQPAAASAPAAATATASTSGEQAAAAEGEPGAEATPAAPEEAPAEETPAEEAPAEEAPAEEAPVEEPAADASSEQGTGDTDRS